MAAASRFVDVPEEEMNLMKENAIPRNTKHATSLFRDFYNHLSNYTKTIIRLRLVNIGEYSPRLHLGEYLPLVNSQLRLLHF